MLRVHRRFHQCLLVLASVRRSSTRKEARADGSRCGACRAPRSRAGVIGGCLETHPVSMAIPVGVLPFGAFPSTAAVPRHPFLRVAHRSSVRLRMTEAARICGACSTFGSGSPQSLPSRRCWPGGPPPLAYPRAGRVEGDGHPGSLDLRALVRCEVRCARPPLPSARRPMLPWALPFEGFHLPLGGRRLRSTPRGLDLSTRETEVPLRSRTLVAPTCTGPKPFRLACQPTKQEFASRPATFT